MICNRRREPRESIPVGRAHRIPRLVVSVTVRSPEEKHATRHDSRNYQILTHGMQNLSLNQWHSLSFVADKSVFELKVFPQFFYASVIIYWDNYPSYCYRHIFYNEID